MDAALDYVDHLARESARFGEALAGVPDDVPVPTCPDWDAVDLLWHLAGVQWNWGEIVRRGITETADAEALEAERPTDRAGVQAFYDGASRGLVEILAARPAESPAWTWADEQTVGFIRRRQAHEALIHRVDAELTADDRTAMDPALSTDGVDEVLRVMYGGVPPWGTFTPEEAQTIRVSTTDTGQSWVLTLGRFNGTGPDGRTETDTPDMRIHDVDDGSDTAAAISGTAADLDCYLWHRPAVGAVERSGDQSVLARFDQTIKPGIS